MSEANKRLEHDAKDHPQNFDIEKLNGNESKVIEMDLMLGVADLHTREAVAAAESALSSCHPVISLADGSSDSDSEEESSDDDDNVDGEIDSNLDEKPISGKDNIDEKHKGNCRSKKRLAIVKLS